MGLCKDGYWRESERYEGKQYIGCAKLIEDTEKGRMAAQKLAIKALSQKISDAKAGTNLINENTTVKTWAATWLETFVKCSDITDKTYKNMEYSVNKNIVKALGTLKLKDVKDVHLQTILNQQSDMSKSHVTKLRAYMKQMFHKAVKSRLLAFSPADDLIIPKTTEGKRRALTPSERIAILKIAETHIAGLWVKTMLYCGLRPGETMALQWRDLDLKKKLINVHQALECGSMDTIKEPKSEAGNRMIPIPDLLVPLFKAKKGKAMEYVFTQVLPENKGKHHTASSIRCYWKSFKREVDISLGAKVYRNEIVKSKLSDDLVPYILRHTYGSDLQSAGVPINVAKYLMGHADISTTANIYTHENDDIIQMAAGLINKHMIKKVIKNDNSKVADA